MKLIKVVREGEKKMLTVKKVKEGYPTVVRLQQLKADALYRFELPNKLQVLFKNSEHAQELASAYGVSPVNGMVRITILEIALETVIEFIENLEID